MKKLLILGLFSISNFMHGMDAPYPRIIHAHINYTYLSALIKEEQTIQKICFEKDVSEILAKTSQKVTEKIIQYYHSIPEPDEIHSILDVNVQLLVSKKFQTKSIENN